MTLPTFEKLVNFRDVGGLPTVDGGFMRSGLIYRSQELHRLTARDLELLGGLGLQMVIDLRSPKNHRKRPGPRTVRVVNVPIVEPGNLLQLPGFLFTPSGGERFRQFCLGFYRSMVSDQRARFGEVMSLLSEPANLPALVHCHAGRDRTGVVAALLQLLAGVSYSLVEEDYLRSNQAYEARLSQMSRFVPARERIRCMMTARPEYLTILHEQILAYGSIERYLEEACGVSSGTLSSLRERLREP